MLLANMSLIPKPNKDHTHPQNYRPISFINNDLIFFGHLLADRLSSIITTLIFPDQTGFIPSRQIIDNIRLASNIIQGAVFFPRKALLLSLDIHKAFDSVLWSYLETILTKFRFQGAFMYGFRALQHHPCARIKLPGGNSVYFTLGLGTRQGCPLFSLLFALAMQPLARSICPHQTCAICFIPNKNSDKFFVIWSFGCIRISELQYKEILPNCPNNEINRLLPAQRHITSQTLSGDI